MCFEDSCDLTIVLVIILKMGVAILSATALWLLKGGEVGIGIGVALALRKGGTVERLRIVFLVVVLWCRLLDKVVSEAAVLFKV